MFGLVHIASSFPCLMHNNVSPHWKGSLVMFLIFQCICCMYQHIVISLSTDLNFSHELGSWFSFFLVPCFTLPINKFCLFSFSLSYKTKETLYFHKLKILQQYQNTLSPHRKYKLITAYFETSSPVVI